MPAIRSRRQRICATLTILWIACLALILPIQLRRRAEIRLSERMANCTHLTPDHKITYDGECMDLAEHLYVIDKSAAGKFFTPSGLLILIAAAFGLPLTIYLVIAIPLQLLRRHRLSNTPPQNDHA